MPGNSPTGLFYLPLPPNTQSPAPQLISHLSRNFEASLLAPYSLDHRLLFDTSSLLPGHPVSSRKYAQFLTLTHQPGRTYVGITTPTTSPSASENRPATAAAAIGGEPAPTETAQTTKIITIPAGFAFDDFFATVLKKMEPLWAIRSSVAVSNGAAFSLSNGDWNIRIGDLRITGGQGQGRVRGVLVEAEFCGMGNREEEDDDANEEDEGGERDDEQILRAFFDMLVDGSRVGTDGMRVVVLVPGMEKRRKESTSTGTTDKNMDLARQYMELLRFAKV